MHGGVRLYLSLLVFSRIFYKAVNFALRASAFPIIFKNIIRVDALLQDQRHRDEREPLHPAWPGLMRELGARRHQGGVFELQRDATPLGALPQR